jgi:hypothetical protein
MPKDKVRAIGNGCGLDGDIGCTLAVSDDDNPLASQLVSGFESRDVDDLTAKQMLPVGDGYIRSLGIKPNAYDSEIEVFDPFLLGVAIDNAPSPSLGSLAEAENCAAEANLWQYTEVSCVFREIVPNLRTGRKIGGVRGQRPIGEFVEFALYLHSEIEISIGPNTTQGRSTFEDTAVEPLFEQSAGGRQSGDACTDDGDAAYRGSIV